MQVSGFRSLGGFRLEKDIHFIPLFLKLIAFLRKKNVSGFLPVKGIMSSLFYKNSDSGKTKEARGPIGRATSNFAESSSQTLKKQFLISQGTGCPVR